MDLDKKNRTELKSYFKGGAKPTGDQFAALMDAYLNQAEDGIAKVQGNPIALQAEGDPAGTQEVLHLFSNFADANPNWSINMNPRVEEGVPGSNQPGLNFKNATGASHLFIKSVGGDVGIGTIEPASRLSIVAKGGTSLISVMSETSGTGKIFEVSQEDNNGVLSIRSGSGTRVAKLSGSTSKPSFFLSKVGIGTDNPEAHLHVKGEAAELKISNTQSGQSPRLNIQGSNGNAWHIANDEDNGNALNIIPAEPGTKGISIRRDGTLHAMGGVLFGERSAHANQDAVMYRLGGNLFLSIDDNFFIRDVGGKETIHFSSNAGRVAIGGMNPEAALSITGSGKSGGPNAAMHIGSDVIMFGGNNAGGSANSGKIHVDATALKIVGKTVGTNAATRKVEIEAEGGLTITGRAYTAQQFVVAFSVSLLTNMTGAKNPLTFGQVNYNQGDHFKNNTHFIAPVAGMYIFTMTMRNNTSGDVGWRLRLNDTRFVNAATGGEPEERTMLVAKLELHMNSRTVITKLEAGDKVHVEQYGSGGNDNYSSGFDGMLLQAFV